VFGRHQQELMTAAKIDDDPISGRKHTIYSLRQTAICMRITRSEGQVNILNIAKNAHISGSDRALLCAQTAPVEGNGDQLAELWKWVSSPFNERGSRLLP
jgi:hypothetical protein